MITMYGIHNCDTVKKAQQFLMAHGVSFEFIDFRQNLIQATVLARFLDEVGWGGLINKRSTTYRNLSDEQKRNMNINLVLENPTLIKRPVLVIDEIIWVGFNQSQYAQLV